MGVRGARTSETSTTQSWLARCSGGMYDSTHSLTCLIAALRKREAEGRLVSRVSVGRIAVCSGEDLRKLDARVPRGAEGSGPESLTLFFFSASASALLGSLKGPAMILQGVVPHDARENGNRLGSGTGTDDGGGIKKITTSAGKIATCGTVALLLAPAAIPPCSSRINPRSSTIPSPSPPP